MLMPMGYTTMSAYVDFVEHPSSKQSPHCLVKKSAEQYAGKLDGKQ
jgi:hypothetical protein